MGTYKANRNNENPENAEKSEKQQKEESTEKLVDEGLGVAAEAVGTYFGIPGGGAIYDSAKNMPVVGDAINGTVHNIGKTLAKTPVGDIAEKADEAGLTDALGTARQMFSSVSSAGAGAPTQGAGAAAGAGGATAPMGAGGSQANIVSTPKMNNSTPGINGNNSALSQSANKTNMAEDRANKEKGLTVDDISDLDLLDGGYNEEEETEEKEKKDRRPSIILLLILSPTAFIFLFLILFLAYDDYANLKLTNNTILASSSVGKTTCTTQEIATKMLYFGDKTVEDIKKVVNNSDIKYISDNNADYNKLADSLSIIESQLSNDVSIVVFALGRNDLNNIDSYVTYYRNFINTHDGINVYFLSVVPSNDANENIAIDSFNQRLKAEFSSKYIDVYSNVIYNYDVFGNIDSNAINAIHSEVLSTVGSSSNVTCSSGTINQISSSVTSGGGKAILKNGESIVSKIGQAELDKWNANIKNDVNKAGKGTGDAIAIAAYDLVTGAYNYGFVIPYFWGGGHGNISDGIDPSWGSSAKITASGSSAQPIGSYQPNGLDCSGFASWALKNGGCSSFSPITAHMFIGLSDITNVNAAKAGDIAASKSHVVVILKNTGSTLLVAEAKGASSGIQINEYNYSKFTSGGYSIMNMTNYYSQHCR